MSLTVAFRLPRLRTEAIVEGKPASPWFRRIWQSLVEDIESNNTSITNILDALTGVEGSVTGLQAQADILDNISDVTGTGLIEKTGDATVTVRAIGTGSASAIPTRLDSDNRYLRQDGTLSASAATTTHKVAVDIGGTTYYILLSNV